MTPISKYYGEETYATVENVLNGHYIVSLYVDDKLLFKQSLSRLGDAENMAENFVMREKLHGKKTDPIDE